MFLVTRFESVERNQIAVERRGAWGTAVPGTPTRTERCTESTGTWVGQTVTRPATFSSKLGFTTVTTNAIPTGRLGTWGALLRPENYLLVLFAISTTLWTVAFLFYFLSTQLAAGLATIARAAHIRRARA